MLKQLLILLLFSMNCAAQTFWTTTVITNLDRPVAFDFAPDGRIFVTQKGGITGPATTAQIKVYDAAYNYLGIFYDLSDSTDGDFERGLIGIAFDPDFSNTHYVYCYYVHLYNGDERLRIVRFTDNNNLGTNPTIIFDYDVPDNIPGVHVGGNLHFRPTEPDKIYFSIGDLGSDQFDTSLNYARKLVTPFGKTLRINKDGTIPTDNPFYDDGNLLTGNCDIIWSYGHRNAFDFCFSSVNDSFYVSENGLSTWDEVNQIHAGKNYGWNECEGNFKNSSTTVPCDDTGSIPPMTTWGNPLGGVTGILFYTGTIIPGLDDHLLVADSDYGNIFDLALGNAPFYDTVLSNTFLTDPTSVAGLTTIREGTDGCIYALNGGYLTNGSIFRICPSWMNVEEHENPEFSLQQNFPNPFLENTTIHYLVKQKTQLQIVLFDVNGKEIAVLKDEIADPGQYELTVDAKTLQLAPGNYFCFIKGESQSQSVMIAVAK
jgi:glucose/arabinose dehydrogenase